MIYELTDTSITLTDTFGNDLGFHPVYVVEADNPGAAVQQLLELYGRPTEGITIKEVG